MANQTQFLIESLPKLSQLISAADRKGSAKWKVVRWKNISPSEVTLDDVQPIAGEGTHESGLRQHFNSRTAALRASADWVRRNTRGYSQLEHWGVWTWSENGHRVYQTALPDLPAVAPAEAVRSQPDRPRSPHGGTMVRVSESAYIVLREIAEEDGISMQAAADAAIEEYDRQRFFAKADAAYRRLRANPEEWAHELQERQELEGTLMDDIDEDEDWTEEYNAMLSRELQNA